MDTGLDLLGSPRPLWVTEHLLSPRLVGMGCHTPQSTALSTKEEKAKGRGLPDKAWSPSSREVGRPQGVLRKEEGKGINLSCLFFLLQSPSWAPYMLTVTTVRHQVSPWVQYMEKRQVEEDGTRLG